MERLRALGLTRPEQALILLLRAGLWHTDVADLTLFPLQESEWREVEELARRQTVQGVVFMGLDNLPVHLLPPLEMRWSWMTMTAAVEEGYQKAMSAASATYDLLTRLGADVVLQKGLAVARYYDHPQCRVNGDIDWYVRCPEDLSSLALQLQSEGLQVELHADGCYSFEYGGTLIELHPYLVDLHTSRGRRVVQELWQSETAETVTLVDGTQIPVPGPMATLLMLTAHTLKHLTTAGIGLRQFCDIARAYATLHGRYDPSQLEEVYRKAGIRRWAFLQHRFLVDVLAAPVEVLPTSSYASSPKKSLRRLLRRVLQDGNFGLHSKSWQAHAAKGRGMERHTAWQVIRHLPFSLRYAPCETICMVRNLIRNKIIIHTA